MDNTLIQYTSVRWWMYTEHVPVRVCQMMDDTLSMCLYTLSICQYTSVRWWVVQWRCASTRLWNDGCYTEHVLVHVHQIMDDTLSICQHTAVRLWMIHWVYSSTHLSSDGLYSKHVPEHVWQMMDDTLRCVSTHLSVDGLYTECVPINIWQMIDDTLRCVSTLCQLMDDTLSVCQYTSLRWWTIHWGVSVHICQ